MFKSVECVDLELAGSMVLLFLSEGRFAAGDE